MTAFQITLPPVRPGEPPFEGPLDLLLHLVKENRVDLFDIPVAEITRGYLGTIELMRELDLDVAGEFLQMAAQLIWMKSTLLLPPSETRPEGPDVEGVGDPRAELVKKLLQYQKYRAAAEEFAQRDILDRNVFSRRARVERIALDGPDALAEVSVFKLVEALAVALKKVKPGLQHQVVVDRLSISDAISRVADELRKVQRARFEALLSSAGFSRLAEQVVATFLALLEMAKLRLVRIYQTAADELWVEAREGLASELPVQQVQEEQYQ